MRNNISSVKNCFGCGICAVKCPRKAICMKANRLGQSEPCVDKKTCTGCGICKDICPTYIDVSIKDKWKKEAYIAVNCDKDMLKKSASGGISAALTYKWILNGGYVCGASGIVPMTKNERFRVEHILIHTITDIEKIQGSKYVQSDITNVLPEIERLLKEGEKVLFFGTSCQVSSLKQFLKIQSENLVCCDLICHGVIGSRMFDDYLKHIEKKEGNRLKDVSFRTKEKPMPFTFTFTFTDADNNMYQKILEKNRSAYYRMFMSCIAYRQSCYECEYASINKPSDITLGDYYEAKEDYPELFKSEKLDMQKGISSVIVHTEAGHRLFEDQYNIIRMYPVELQKVVASHIQLQTPSQAKKGSFLLLMLYRIFGWSGVECFYRMFDGMMSLIRR